MQYGTVAKFKVQPGKLDELRKTMESEEMGAISGLVSTLVYQMDRDSSELYIAVIFESKDAYVKNAESPEQDARYQKLRALLERDPEWNDGIIIHHKG